MDKALLELFKGVLVGQRYYCDGDKVTIQFRDKSQITLAFGFEGCINYGWREYVQATYSKKIGETTDYSRFQLPEAIYNARDHKWFTRNPNGKGVIPHLNQKTPPKTLSSKACIWLDGLIHRWGENLLHWCANSLNVVDELCGNCDREVTLAGWDVETDGYKAYCPYCGEVLMLCDMCQHDRYTGKHLGGCDYSSKTDSCKHNPPREV